MTLLKVNILFLSIGFYGFPDFKINYIWLYLSDHIGPPNHVNIFTLFDTQLWTFAS